MSHWRSVQIEVRPKRCSPILINNTQLISAHRKQETTPAFTDNGSWHKWYRWVLVKNAIYFHESMIKYDHRITFIPNLPCRVILNHAELEWLSSYKIVFCNIKYSDIYYILYFFFFWFGVTVILGFIWCASAKTNLKSSFGKKDRMLIMLRITRFSLEPWM